MSAEAPEYDTEWTCTLCDERLGSRPVKEHAGHHFHEECLDAASAEDKARGVEELDKEAQIGARVSDRKWTQLWFRGKLRVSDHNGKQWVLLDTHKGLCQAAFDSLKSEGVECESRFDSPHISVLRPDEVEELKKKFGHDWRGAAKEGKPMRFKLSRLVSLIPSGWPEMDRVWFIECESPDLVKYRRDLGFDDLPLQPKKGYEMRFHVTFAVHKNTARKAAELFSRERAERGLDGGLWKEASGDKEGEQLNKVFEKMELDPEVTLTTLGERFTNAGAPTLLRASQKLLNISKGTEDVDDRDSLAYQTLHTPEDFFGERIRKDAGQVGRKLLWRSTLRGNVQHVPAGALSPQLMGVLLRSGMGQPLEETNPIEIYDQHQRVLRLGEGGIPSLDSIPDECYDARTEVFTADGWRYWDEVTLDTELACRIDDRLVYHKPLRLIRKPYSGELYCVKTRTLDICVTPNHRMWTRKYRGNSSVERCGIALWEFELAKDGHRNPREFSIRHLPFEGGTDISFVLPEIEGSRIKFSPFSLDDWAELLGWYVSEGSIDSYALRYRSKYRITISQSETANPEKVKRIAMLLRRIGINFSYGGHNFAIVNKTLGTYFESLGTYGYEKRLPNSIFSWPLSARGRLFQSLMSGDGSWRENGYGTYTSTSKLLIEQVARLAITLGHPVRENRKPRDYEKKTQRRSYHIYVLSSATQGVTSERMYDEAYSKIAYEGEVFCAEVSGELLLVRRNGSVPTWSGNSRNVQPSHFGYVDPVRAPESSKIGVDARISHRTMKGSDGKFYTHLRDKDGKEVPVSAETAARSVVAFPGELERGEPTVRAMVRSRQVEYVPRGEVDYELPSAGQMFSASSNLVPLISGIKGGRLLMGAKFVTQALPLRNAEAPLVQNLSETGQSYDELYSEQVGALRARERGVVTDVGKDGITVRYADGLKETHELYENFPFNRRTFIHSTPTARIGDTVEKGQLLARSNYTDEKGTLAVGTNLRVAYMPYKGLNYEDAVVVSESAAKKLASEHMFQNALEMDEGREVGRPAYISVFPTKFSRVQLDAIGKNGVVKPGAAVKYGDPLILALDRAKLTSVHRGHKPMFSDGAVTWDHEFPGMVTDVDQNKDGGWNVTVKAYAPAQEGDKLAGRYGDKGVIAKVISDDQMIQGKDGKPYELLLNPLGVISRGNPSQVYEALLGKAARARGEAYKLPSFADESLIDYVKKELARNKLNDTEDLTDPATGRRIPKVLTGERFVMKLHHTAESKGKGRGDAGAYTSEGLPARGGEFGSKRVSSMEQYSLLSHGATSVLRDAQVVRGQRNDDYWRAFRMGMPPPSPKVPMIYNKFLAYLQGSGINVKKDGHRLQLFALTDKDIGSLSSGAVRTPDTVKGDTVDEIDGGLFDRGLTGGHGGNRWSHIDLHEPIPNPIMEEPIRRLLGLTGKQYLEVIAGTRELAGGSGGTGIKDALRRINIDALADYHTGIIKDGPKSKRDNSVKVLGYLKAMKKSDLRPEDFVLTKVPVLPPAFRPITPFKNMLLTADPNYLYRDLMLANNDLQEMRGVVSERQLGGERTRLYEAFKAVAGLGDPVQAKTQERGVRGLLAHVFGSSPKFGMFQRRVLGSPVDVVGRAVITPNPELGMDQVGLPESKAWTIYRPFIMRRLVRAGLGAADAAKAIAGELPVARKAMLEEMSSRPVLINRAPTLHRYGFMAAWPVLTKGNTLQIPPVITPGFNADFDGDAMNYHVPATDEAVQEAIERMMPSRNLRSTRDFKVHYVPRMEFMLGLYLASTSKNDKPTRIFRERKDVMNAYAKGEIGLGDKVLLGKE
jgi:DNA-directed RNA polymerase beta subunit